MGKNLYGRMIHPSFEVVGMKQEESHIHTDTIRIKPIDLLPVMLAT